MALKRLHSDEPASVARLLREARIGGRLHHENLVATHDVGRDEVGWFLVLDYVEGHSLSTVLDQLARSGGCLAVPLVLHLVQQICAGLAHAHRATDEEGRSLGLVHGDLSPANVLVRSDGLLKVADFGAARTAFDEADHPTPRGTPGYGAPELALGRCDARADLYSVGAILRALLQRVPEAMLPTELPALLATLLAESPEARPEDATTLAAAFAALRSGLPAQDAPLPHLVGPWASALVTLSAEPDAAASVPLPARPYRGLESFRANSAALFFGRDEDARRLAERVRRSPLVVLTGASGAGKSSLLAAGLPACLSDFVLVPCRLGPDPVAGMARALAPGDPHVAAALAERPHEAAAILAHRLAPRTALVIDQAETLITLAAQARLRDAAATIVAALVTRGVVRVVLAVRADFLAQLCDLEALRALAGRSVELLALPSRALLGRALTGPLEPFGARFESEALVDRIVSAVVGRPGALALLQFCADRLWDARDPSSGVLGTAAYERLGGVTGALASYADEVLAGFAPEEQEVARRMLVRTLTSDGTQQPVPVEILVGAPWSGAHGLGVLERLVAARLLTRRFEPDLGPVVEPAHEALAAHWRRLDGWVTRDVEAHTGCTKSSPPPPMRGTAGGAAPICSGGAICCCSGGGTRRISTTSSPDAIGTSRPPPNGSRGASAEPG